MTPPIITKDPRFQAGRTLVQTGRTTEGAIDIFATLLEESISKYGPVSLEAASCYYEYGNALFRGAAVKYPRESQLDHDDHDAVEKPLDPKMAAFMAAEKRSKGVTATTTTIEQGTTTELDPLVEKLQQKESPAVLAAAAVDETVDQEDTEEEKNEQSQDNGNDDNDDVHLACEMMENAWSILDQYMETNPCTAWLTEQRPRMLVGIADVLLVLERHGDAVDAYTRALPLREAILQDFDKNDLSLDRLKASRQVVEANVLIAEALLACEPGHDVVTTETNTVLVTAAEREFYTQGYYDKARDSLQDTVFLMGQIAAKGVDLGNEKEDICFISTLLMGVGEKLAELEELKLDAGCPPSKKQRK
jgi:tetratricopeptide (TPR) repeat protein